MITCIPEFIAHHASVRPGALALKFRDETVSYSELATRIDRLANVLLDAGCRHGDRVGIYMEKCTDAAVAMYAIMKIGGAYVPLDPGAPATRLQAMIDDCEIQVLITQATRRRSLRTLCMNASGIKTLIGVEDCDVDSVRCVPWSSVAVAPTEFRLKRQVRESDLAYIIYTSGSTGVPKGIMHTHHSGLAFAHWAVGEYGIVESDRLSNHAPLHFDLSIMDYFAAAIAGACTVIIPEDVARMPASYSEYIEVQQITMLYTVPFALIQLLTLGALEARDLSKLRWVIFGGEPMVVKHLRALMDLLPRARFDNMYGPAEVNGVSHYTVPPQFIPEGELPIGKIADIAGYRVVTASDQEVGLGETGELLVSTPTMMQGYWARPTLNANAFWSPSANSGSQQVYFRTGDLVRESKHGNLIFVGRKDRQVKIRGYRVELDEVEAALACLDKVAEAAVIAVADDSGDHRLHGFVRPVASGVDIELIGRALKQTLPRYALPGEIKVLTDFPRTSTDKIDRKQLLANITNRSATT